MTQQYVDLNAADSAMRRMADKLREVEVLLELEREDHALTRQAAAGSMKEAEESLLKERIYFAQKLDDVCGPWSAWVRKRIAENKPAGVP